MRGWRIERGAGIALHQPGADAVFAPAMRAVAVVMAVLMASLRGLLVIFLIVSFGLDAVQQPVDGEVGEFARAAVDDADGGAVPLEPRRVLVAEQGKIAGNGYAAFGDYPQNAERRFMVGDKDRAGGLGQVEEFPARGGTGRRLEMADKDQGPLEGDSGLAQRADIAGKAFAPRGCVLAADDEADAPVPELDQIARPGIGALRIVGEHGF